MFSFDILTPFCQVPQVHFSLKFSENTPIFDALGSVLVDAQEFHQKSFPLAKSIQRCVQLLTRNTNENLSIFMFTRSNACFYAHESTSKYYRLTDRIVTNGKFCLSTYCSVTHVKIIVHAKWKQRPTHKDCAYFFLWDFN